MDGQTLLGKIAQRLLEVHNRRLHGVVCRALRCGVHVQPFFDPTRAGGGIVIDVGSSTANDLGRRVVLTFGDDDAVSVTRAGVTRMERKSR